METRDRILEAAYRCFSKKGYLGTKTREIAQVAGISEVTLFRYFRSKEKLFEEVLKKYSVIPDIEKIKQELSLSQKEKLKKTAEEILTSLKEKQEFIRILLAEISSHPEEIYKIFRDFVEKLDLLIAEILSTDRETARLFHCSLFGYFITEEIFLRKKIGEEELKEVVDKLSKLYLEQENEKTG